MIRVIVAFAIAFLVSATTTYSGDAGAKWMRSHSFRCKSWGGTPVDGSYGLQNDSSNDYMTAVCEVNNTDYMPISTVASLNLHGYVGWASGLCAKTCRAYYDGGGTCGSQTCNSTAGERTVSPSVSGWSNGAYDFPYLWVSLAYRHDVNGPTLIRGIYMADQ